MYLAQTIDPSPTLRALTEAGISGYLLVGLICAIGAWALAWAVLRNRGKQIDTGSKKIESDAAVMTALTGVVSTLTVNITKLTDNQLEMQTGARKRDQQIDLTIKSTDEQNRLLTAGNQLAQRMLSAIQDNTKDTHDVLDATVNHLDGKVSTFEANVLAKIDTQTERIINKNIDSHANLKQTIIERTKSIEDLFVKITNDNEDLTAKVELREATIVSLQSQLSKATQERDALKKQMSAVIPQPEPPDPPPPPDGSGAKQSVPPDVTDMPDLSRTERAA